jgi:SAM-dependent methyltransferase
MTRSPEINYLYFRHYVQSLPRAAELRVLDYGCGAGEVVELLREAGLQAEGCDVYYEGGSSLDSSLAQELMRAGHLRSIDEQSDLPYPPGTFDVIIANMVFEHVRDLEAVLRRLRRVLKVDGHILAHFPTQEVMREGHIGIPFAHRLRRGSRLRYFYTLGLRRLGLGYFKDQVPSPKGWTDRHLSWIDHYCFYRSMPEVRRIFAGHFDVAFNEMQYMCFRAGSRPWLLRLLALPGSVPLWCWIFRRLAFTALQLRPIRIGEER